MSGADTIRGISYQHACVIAASIDVVENPQFGSIRIESSDDIVDFDILNVEQSPVRVAQVKARSEPYTFAPAELIAIINEWSALDQPSIETYELISDAQLSPTGHDLIGAPLDSLRQEDHSAAVEELRRAGLTHVPERVMRRVRFRMRNGDTNSVLESTEYRVLRLAELSGPATSEQAIAGVDKLFRAISVRGGSKNRVKRTLTREEISTVLGLNLNLIDSGRQWTRSLADAFRATVISTPPAPSIFLELSQSTSEHPALRLSQLSLRDPEGKQNYSADTLVEAFSRCAIAGVTGAGKSTTLELVAYEVAKRGGLPVFISPAQYLSGSIRRLVRETLERTSNATLAPGATDVALSDESCVLLVDGLTERPVEEANQLRRDLVELADGLPRLRIFISGRRHEGFRLPGIPILELQGLDDEKRAELGRLLMPTADHASIVSSVTRSLDDLAANPLLFTMALSLRSAGAEVSTRAALYSAIVQGLWARLPDEEHVELVEEVLARVARQLVERGQFRLSNRSWSDMALAILNALRSEGGFSVGERSVEDTLQSASRAGLIRTVPFTRETVFLHDSFRDYFAAKSYLSRSGLPERLSVDHEASIEILGEDAGITRELALKAAAENPVLFVKLSRSKRPTRHQSDWELARQLLSLLFRNHLGSDVDVASTVGLRICPTATRTWFALTDTGLAAEVRTPSGVMEGGEVRRGFSLEGTVHPLQLASIAWLTVVEEAIQSALTGRQTQWHRSFGSEPSELIGSVIARADAQKQTLSSVAMRIIPTIADRVLAIAGPLGLRAVIDPPSIAVDGEHLMHYRYEDGPHNVVFANSPQGDHRQELYGQTSAESYIDRSGEGAAIEKLLKAVHTLFGEKRD